MSRDTLGTRIYFIMQKICKAFVPRATQKRLAKRMVGSITRLNNPTENRVAPDKDGFSTVLFLYHLGDKTQGEVYEGINRTKIW
jgi:hypothetical protein